MAASTDRHAGATEAQNGGVALVAAQRPAMRTRFISVHDLSPLDEAAWRDLAMRSLEPNPFYEVDFVVPACRHLRDGKRVALLVAEDAGRFYACLPVRVGTLRSLPVISSWRHEYGFLGTPLVAAERGEEAVRSLLAGMRGAGRRQRIVVLELFGDDGPIASCLRRAADELGLTVHVHASGERAVFRCHDQAADDLPPAIKRELRGKARQWRRLRGDWGEPRVVDVAQEADSSERFLSMEASGWKGRSGTALACRASDAAFFNEVTDRFRASGKLRLFSLEAGGKVLAMQADLHSGTALFDWKVAYDEDFGRYGPGVQLQLRVLEWARQAGVSWVDTCSEATDEHQLRLSPARRRIATLAIARGRDGWRAEWTLRLGVVVAKLSRHLANLSVRTVRSDLVQARRALAGRLR